MNLTELPRQLRRQRMAPRIASRRVDREGSGPKTPYTGRGATSAPDRALTCPGAEEEK
jgi:hypothetical protein